MRKILVPIAYFESCREALKLAGRLSRGLSAALTVLHVVPPPRSTPLGSEVASGKLAEWGIEPPHFKLLEQAQETLKDLGILQLDPMGKPVERHSLKLLSRGLYEVHLVGKRGQDVRFRMREGKPVSEILREAEDPEYDLIITGTRGHRGLKRFWLGSVAQEVALHALCSILVAKNLKPGQGILVGVSGRETALEAVRQAGELAKALEASMLLVAAITEEREFPQAEADLSEAKELLRSQGHEGPLETRIRLGDPARILIEEAAEGYIIVLGRAGRSKMQKFLLGDISLKILERSAGPVLITASPRPQETLPPQQTLEAHA